MKAAKDAKDARSNASSPSTMNIFERDKGEKAEPKGGKKRGEKVRERGADKEEESQAEEESWSKIDEILENSLSGDGKLTVGGMLMHFMYFYGTVFDAYSQKIDATEARGVPSKRTDDRKALDPETGLPCHDPLVILNPLAASLNKDLKGSSNVAKSCFAFQSLQWFFANSFNTLELASKNGGGGGGDEGDGAVLLDLIISF